MKGNDMSITATELKLNMSKYLKLSEKEDIYITVYGKVVAKLTNPHQSKIETAESLFGSLLDTMSLEEAKERRFS